MRLRQPASLREVVPLLADKDPFIVSAAVDVLGRPGNAGLLLTHRRSVRRPAAAGAARGPATDGRRRGARRAKQFLKDADPEIRRSAIQWVGEEGLKEYAPQLQATAAQVPTTPALFQALLASNHLLSGGKPDAEPFDENYLAKVVGDAAQPSAFRVLALQMLRPDHPALSAANLEKLLAGNDEALRRQAVRTLTLRTDKDAQALLLKLAKDDAAEPALRADAVLGLANSAAESADVQRFVLSLLDQADYRRDALRSLRPAARAPDVETGLLGWWDRATLTGDERREAAGQTAACP